MLLRNRLLGGVSFGAVYAAETGNTAAPAADAAPAATPSPSPSEAASSPPGPEASEAAAGAATPAATPSADAAPAASEAAPAKETAPTSLLAEAPAKAPGEAEAAKPAADAKPDAKADAKPESDKAAETPAPADAKKPESEAAKKDDAAKDAKAEGDGTAPAKEALAEAPPARTYEAFKVPDGLKLDDTKVKDFTTILENAELSHQERGQGLIDLFVKEMQDVQVARDQHQRDVFNQLQNGWKEELRGDPQVGGNRLDTALGRAKWVVEAFGGDKKNVDSLLAQMSYTGMGNNVHMVRLLDNLAEILSEGEIVPANAGKLKDTRPRSEKWYGGNGAG